MFRRIGLSLGMVWLASGSLACGGNSADSEDTGASSEDVVGVTDLSALETALGLRKDVVVSGHYTRSNTVLHAGPCYQEKLGPFAKDPQNWQFRRYTTGAAFFHVQGSAPETGPKRPIACVDIDDSAIGGTSKLDGYALDSTLRYGFGKIDTLQSGETGHTVAYWAHGRMRGQTPSQFCGTTAGNETAPSGNPGLDAYYNEMKSCTASKGTNCQQQAENACVWWSTLDTQTESMDRPSFNGEYLDDQQIDASAFVLSPAHAYIAYKYAWARAEKSDQFAEANDAVGKFVKSDQTGTHTIARFEHADVHRLIWGQAEGLYVTPPNNDATFTTTSVAKCTRTLDASGTPSSAFSCSGI